MIDRKKFDNLVKEYQNYFTNHKGENGESYWEEEEFKWRGIKTFQDNWDLDAQNLSDMIKHSLYGVSHMMVSQARFPEGMIEDFAEREPETVRAMFKNLFDENKDIVERFHSFKQNLKQGIVIQIIMLLLGIVLAFDLYFCRMMSGQGAVYRIFSYIFVAALFVYTMLFLWIYPVLAKFFNTTKNLFRNSILMSIRHLPYTILMMVITAAPVLLGIFVAQAFPFMILFCIMLGFATVAYINSRFFVKLFDNYIPEDAGKDTEENGEEKAIDTSIFSNLHPTELPVEDVIIYDLPITRFFIRLYILTFHSSFTSPINKSEMLPLSGSGASFRK